MFVQLISKIKTICFLNCHFFQSIRIDRIWWKNFNFVLIIRNTKLNILILLKILLVLLLKLFLLSFHFLSELIFIITKAMIRLKFLILFKIHFRNKSAKEFNPSITTITVFKDAWPNGRSKIASSSFFQKFLHKYFYLWSQFLVRRFIINR